MQTEGTIPPQPPGALHRLPSPPEYFTGREIQLRELKASAQGQPGTWLGLYGEGGVGKTALALQLAHDLAASYPTAELYFEPSATEQPLTAVTVMRATIYAFHPTATLPEDQGALRAAFDQVMRGQRVLFILDSVSGGEGLAQLSPPAGCLILITARESLRLPKQLALRVDRLPAPASQALLRKIAPRIGKLAGEIAELCGGLPLALRLAGSALAARTDLDPAEYADRLQAEQWNQSPLDEAQASLALSYDLLEPALRQHWRQLAAFPGQFGRAAAASLWAVDPAQATRTLQGLLRDGLISRDERSRRFQLHALARLAANSRLGPGESDEMHRRQATYYLQVLDTADKLSTRGKIGFHRGLSLFDLEQTNMRAGQAWAASHAAEDSAAAQLATDYPIAGAALLSKRLPSLERKAWLEAAVAAAQRLGNRAAESRALGKLGSLYRRQSEPRWAIEFYERYLRVAREASDRRGEGEALGNLGLTYAELGNARRAIDYYQQSLTISSELDDQRGVARTSWNLGLAHQELGDLASAIAAMQVCVDFELAAGHPDAQSDLAVIWKLRRLLANTSAGKNPNAPAP